MNLLDYRNFLMLESNSKLIVAADKADPGEEVIGQVTSDKIDRLKSQLHVYSLETAIDGVISKSGDPALGNVLKRALASIPADKLVGVSYVLANKPPITFSPSDYESGPSTTLWDTYRDFFSAGLPEGTKPLSDSDLSILWQIQDPRTGGSVGPGEIILTVFTDMKKGSTGDLAGSGFQMEVKGQNAKCDGYASWATVKAQLTTLIQTDLGNKVKMPSGDGFTKEWADITSQWLNGNRTVRIPLFTNLIVGTDSNEYVKTIETSIDDKKLDYGVFACQILWYSQSMPFNYILTFADPNKNKPLSMIINCSKGGLYIYSQLVANYKSPNWESKRNGGSFNLKGTSA